MKPFFFGSAERQLYGFYHPPRAARPRDVGVLLCYPAPQEYMPAHRAMRQLAVLLAKEGYPVLRFDYYGTGDSAGSTGEGDVATWQADTKTAFDELKDVAGVNRVSIVGLRLGAAIAALATSASKSMRLRDLVLWEPVVDGKRYAAETAASQEYRIWDTPWRGDGRNGPRPDEMLGYPYGKAMAKSVEAVDLAAAAPFGAERVVLAVSSERDDYMRLKRALDDAKSRVDLVVVADEANAGAGEAALLSHKIMAAIVTALGAGTR